MSIKRIEDSYKKLHPFYQEAIRFGFFVSMIVIVQRLFFPSNNFTLTAQQQASLNAFNTYVEAPQFFIEVIAIALVSATVIGIAWNKARAAPEPEISS